MDVKLYKLFSEVAQKNSRAVKENYLINYPDQDTLKIVLRLTYDPFITFGITDFTESIGKNGRDILGVLDLCASRKVTGNEARSMLGASLFDSPLEVKQLVKNILNKDLRCGVSEKTVVKLYPGLIRQFDVMRAEKYTPISSVVYVEPKYDGLRCIAIVENGQVSLLSRNGREFTAADHLKPILLRQGADLGDRVFDGELIAPGGFNASVSSVKRKVSDDNPATYVCFECIPLSQWGMDTPYELRRATLTENCKSEEFFAISPAHMVNTHEAVWKLYLQFLHKGLEGAMVKSPGGKYHFKRHADWMKLKEVCDADLEVIDLLEGEGRLKGKLGAAVVDYNGTRVHVGTGFSDKERQDFWWYKNRILGKTIEIQYHQETPDGSLRHPRFVKVRTDK